MTPICYLFILRICTIRDHMQDRSAPADYISKVILLPPKHILLRVYIETLVISIRRFTYSELYMYLYVS